MKRTLITIIALLLAVLPVIAAATNSRSNPDIPQTVVTNVVAEDENEEVVPPVVEIIPDTPEVQELQETLKTIYRLTIYYVYADGSTASQTYDAMLQAGTEYSVASPEIKGYTPSVEIVADVMPMRDMEYTVVYVSPEAEISAFPYAEMETLFTIEDYEAPTGLGFSVSNVGICFE